LFQVSRKRVHSGSLPWRRKPERWDSAVTNTLAVVASENRKLKDSAGCSFFGRQRTVKRTEDKVTQIASSIYKRQTRPLVREGAPQNKTVTVKQ
jgi:hypothetical protein